MPPSTIPFWVTFVTTVLLLVVSLVTGWTRKRRAHLWLGPLTMVSLVVTVKLTEELVSRYDFPPDDLAFHLKFAKAGGYLALPVILTGVWLWKKPKARLWHQIAVYVWLAAVLTATGTGLWMFGLGTLKTA
ncbi:MAG: hypothetical protein H6835_06735 [Planctomycetes bacterium]|nr:hypothetical protein [Planctomycetota bacterium]